LSLRFRIRAGSRLAAAASVERVVQIEPRDGDLVIGRRRGSDIELPFAAVSEQHARLSRGEQGWLLADWGSANGTSVNGHRLTPFVAQALSVGDVLRLASVELVFEGEGGPAPGAVGKAGVAESTATLARRLVSDLFGTGRPTEVARVVVTNGPARDRELRLEVVGCCYRVGRGVGCNLVVPDDDISREHAEFERRWDGVFVRDLDSKNGVLLMGERLASERRLSDGDVLRLGQTTFRLDDPEDRYLRQLEEVEGRSGQAAQAGTSAESAPSGDPDGRADGTALAETHTSFGPSGKGSARRSSTAAASPSQVASSQSVGRGRRPQRHAPLALMVIAALVLVGAIVLALSFILGT
jgi:pSer/pThr/pTyr-binding forkhead associated (FHA) protein